MKRILLTIGFLLLFAATASAATKYFSPTGGANSPCLNNGAPCAMSLFASEVTEGTTAILQNGDYGRVTFDCAAGFNNGKVTNPIIVQAQNERQAIFSGANGSAASLTWQNCSYWTIQGFQLRAPGSSYWQWGRWQNLDHITYKRNLHVQPSTYVAGAPLGVHGYGPISNSTVEQNEFYDMPAAMVCGSLYGNCDDNIFRLNYFNLRSGSPYNAGFGDTALALSIRSGSRNKIYNNFFEGGGSIDMSGSYGNIVGNDVNGNVMYHANGPLIKDEGFGPSPCPSHATGIIVKNNVVVFPTDVATINSGVNHWGVNARNLHDPQITNNTIIGTAAMNNTDAYGGISTDNDGSCTSGPPESVTAILTNNLVYNWSGATPAHRYAGLVGYTVTFEGVNNNTTNFFDGGGNSGVSISSSALGAPNQGNCPLFIAATSKYHAAGSGGADIGGTVLFQLDDSGNPTSTQLWNTSTGNLNSALFGAVISGQNSTNGLNTFGSRANAGCTSWPSGYGGSVPSIAITSPASNPFSTGSTPITITGTSAP